MDRQPLSTQKPMARSSAREHDALVAMIENLHAMILTKADPGLVLEALDALARCAERQLGVEKVASRSDRTPSRRVRQLEHRAFLGDLNVFRQEFATAPSDFDQAQLYDFLSEWLIHALYED